MNRLTSAICTKSEDKNKMYKMFDIESLCSKVLNWSILRKKAALSFLLISVEQKYRFLE